MLKFTAKCKGRIETFSLSDQKTLGNLKSHLCGIFGLESCKIVGIRVPRKLAKQQGGAGEDALMLSALPLRSGRDNRIRVLGASADEAASVKRSDAEYEERLKVMALLEEEERRAREAREAQERERAAKEAEDAARRAAAYRAREQQRRQEAERRREEAREQRLAREIASETDDAASVRFVLVASRSAEADAKGRVLLPPLALERAVEAKVPFPLIFQVSRADPATGDSMDVDNDGDHDDENDDENDEKEDGQDSKRVDHPSASTAYASVLEFTAPAAAALVPLSILESISAREGDEVLLESTRLRKATSVVIQPADSRWFLEIPDEEERKALLEFSLLGHQFLRRGQKLKVEYLGKQYALHVRDTQPDETVLITDTDLSTQITNEYKTLSDTHTNIKPGEKGERKMTNGQPAMFRFEIENASRVYALEITAPEAIRRAGLDVYVTKQSSGVRSMRPGPTYFQWASQCEEHPSVILSDTSPAFAPGVYFVAIYGNSTDPKLSGQVKVELRSVSKAEAKASKLIRTNDPSQPKMRSDGAAAAGTVICANCRREIPSSSAAMHRLHCERRNYRCEDCGVVIPRRFSKRHRDLAHSRVACECGMECKDQATLVGQHRARECELRPMRCFFCPMRVQYREREKHHRVCGMRPAICVRCNGNFKRREMRYHMSSKHGVSPEDVTFRDYF